MSDYISRQAAIDAVMNTEPIVFDTQSLEPHQKTKDVTESIYAIPAADVVEVVRCKDCKNRVDSQLTDCKEPNFCMRLACYANENDYCSYGERADGDEL